MYDINVIEETFSLKVDEENYSINVINDGFNMTMDRIALGDMIRKYMIYNINTRLVVVGE